MKKLIILYIIISSFLHSQDDRVIISINGLESAGLSKRHINFAQYSIREISIDLEEIVSKMIGDKYSINIHFTAYESVENTTNVARDSLNKIIKIIKDKYPDENLVTHHISHPYKGIQGIIIGKVQIQINIDNSINLDNISSDYFDWIFMDLQDCRECILFNNVDMASIKGKNTISLNRDDIYDDSWAVIIGIDKYKYSNQLNYAVKDAEAVKNMLINKFAYPEENIRYLTDEEATLSNIKLNLGEVATSAGENDRILVFYSGHGETLIGADNSEKGYIIPFEGKQDNPYATGIAMDEILTTSQISKSKHMLFLMDACYSGLMTENVKGLAKPKEQGYLSKVANEKSRQIITAGGRDEQVIERDEWQHSAFTKNLLAGLDDWEADYNNDSYITADELSTYLREHVTVDSDFLQTPQDARFRNSGGGEFVFFSDATITIPSSDTDEEDEILYGCMDESANNYNPNATKRDRSCQYGKLITSLEFGEFDEVDNIVPIIMNNNESIKTFSFVVSGVKVINVLGGIAEKNGLIGNDYGISYKVNSMVDEGVYVFGSSDSFEMDLKSGGNQILCYLKIELVKDLILNNMCMSNIELISSKGTLVKNVYNVSLTCYGD